MTAAFEGGLRGDHHRRQQLVTSVMGADLDGLHTQLPNIGRAAACRPGCRLQRAEGATAVMAAVQSVSKTATEASVGTEREWSARQRHPIEFDHDVFSGCRSSSEL